MTKKKQKLIKKQLAKAGDWIAKGKVTKYGLQYIFICTAMEDIAKSKIEWMKLPSAKMIKPDSHAWWSNDDSGVQARLLGIAMMITMPDDMIDFNL